MRDATYLWAAIYQLATGLFLVQACHLDLGNPMVPDQHDTSHDLWHIAAKSAPISKDPMKLSLIVLVLKEKRSSSIVCAAETPGRRVRTKRSPTNQQLFFSQRTPLVRNL